MKKKIYCKNSFFYVTHHDISFMGRRFFSFSWTVLSQQGLGSADLPSAAHFLSSTLVPEMHRCTAPKNQLFRKPAMILFRWREKEFTHFLPLYLNNQHGQHALDLAEKIIQELYEIDETKEFDPILALKFLSKLMNTTVVALMLDVSSEDPDSSRSITEDHTPHLFSSIKAIQTYMYMYHLLLGFVHRYSEICDYAREKLDVFVNEPLRRNKENFPDLGELVVYLSIVNKSWVQVGQMVVKEGQVRNVKCDLEKIILF